MSPDQAVTGMSHHMMLEWRIRHPEHAMWLTHRKLKNRNSQGTGRQGQPQGDRNGHLVSRQSHETVHLRALILLSINYS